MREPLPGHGRDIYGEASTAPGSSTPTFRSGETHKTRAIARSAVKQVYEKGAGGAWRREEERHIRSCSGQSCLPGARPGERSCGTTYPIANIFQ
ncbi:MAG: hypothetical protein GX932_09580 [Methanomicrobiales archaeon]|nr:hypothetical protein [Methanomicrobiales archaeon]